MKEAVTAQQYYVKQIAFLRVHHQPLKEVMILPIRLTIQSVQFVSFINHENRCPSPAPIVVGGRFTSSVDHSFLPKGGRVSFVT